ncbi:hypothetical protein MKX01_001339, partial [Papaver californicum]
EYRFVYYEVGFGVQVNISRNTHSAWFLLDSLMELKKKAHTPVTVITGVHRESMLTVRVKNTLNSQRLCTKTFLEMWVESIKENEEGLIKKGGSVMVKHRWSDCNCESCLSWQKFEDQNLYVVKQPSPIENLKSAENVIFFHGFLSSSYLWTENVFPNLSHNGNQNCWLFAVDLLGFGKSPKPSDCFYTINDHLEMVEKSVINKFQLDSFHLVAHSMGCIIALGIASKYQNSVKSVTLIAPVALLPFFKRASKFKCT